MGSFIMCDAAARRYAVVGHLQDKGASAGPIPAPTDRMSRPDGTGFVENLCRAVAGASEPDNRSPMALRDRQDSVSPQRDHCCLAI